MMNKQRADLTQLEYTQQWFDCGILTEAKLEEQLVAFAKGEDNHTEHYRYQTLSSYITGQQAISNEILHRLLKVVVYDTDSSMASSAVILLLKQFYLTDEQFEFVAESLITFGEWTHKEVARQREQRSKCNI